MKKIITLVTIVIFLLSISKSVFANSHQDHILYQAENCYYSSMGTSFESSLSGMYYDMLSFYNDYKEYNMSDMYLYAVDGANLLILTGQAYGVQGC